MAGGQRPGSRSPHQGVGVAFEIMIEGGGARGNQRGSEYGVRHAQPVERAARSQGIPGHGGHHDQKRDVRLGQRQIQSGAAGLRPIAVRVVSIEFLISATCSVVRGGIPHERFELPPGDS